MNVSLELAPLLALLLAMVWCAPALLGAALLLGVRWRAHRFQTVVVVQSLLLLGCTVALLGAYVAQGLPQVEVVAPAILREGDWAWLPVFLVDPLALAYLALVAVVFPVIVRFSMPAMAREPGAQRYWFLVSLFAAALVVVSLSGSVDVLYLGWELVGVTSVMLISFFRQSVRSNANSLRALVSYRLGDLGLLGAAVFIHHAFPDARFSAFSADAQVPAAEGVALALMVAAAAKSAQLPLSPWLHRAMEGPAASSGIFYGALSTHLGPFLLLRTAALWMPHTGVRVAMAAMGGTTALYATLVGRTRPDAKTTLAYATMAQLGIILVEVALGLHTLALVHLWAHAGLRTWQFLRSSSLIQDFQDNPRYRAGQHLARTSGLQRLLPAAVNQRLYLAASRQFWLDGVQWHLVARPVLGLMSWALRVEDAWLGASAQKGNTAP